MDNAYLADNGLGNQAWYSLEKFLCTSLICPPIVHNFHFLKAELSRTENFQDMPSTPTAILAPTTAVLEKCTTTVLEKTGTPIITKKWQNFTINFHANANN